MDVQAADSGCAAPEFGIRPGPGSSWTLDSLLGSLPVRQFCSQHWGKLPLHVARGDPDFYRDLISIGELEQYFSLGEFFSRHHVSTPSRDRGGPDGPPGSASELHDRLGQGCSLRLRRMECFMHPSAPAMVLLRAMEAALQHPVGSFSCYVTPGNASGLGPHHDESEIFTLQIAGTKRWRMFHRVDTDVPGLHEEEELGAASLDITLGAGDLLYVPRGLVHHVTNETPSFSLAPSFSLTIVFQPFKWSSILDLLAGRIARTSPFIAPLPAGVLHAGSPSDAFRDEFEQRITLVRDALAALSAEALLDELAPLHLRGMAAPPGGGMALMLDNATLDSWVERSAGVAVHLMRAGGQVMLVLAGGYTLQADMRVEPAFRQVVDATSPFRVNDIHAALNPAARLAFAQRLIGCGLLRTISPCPPPIGSSG